MLKDIQAEKARLISEGKLRRSNPLPPVSDDEIPFDIPDKWVWVRLGEIVNIVSARRVHQSDWQKQGVPFYRAREIAKLAEKGYVNNELFISETLFEELSLSGIPKANDLMVTAVGTLGKTYIVKEEDRFYYKDASVICLENFAQQSASYLKFILSSNMMIKQIQSNSSGTTVATLTMVRMVNYIIPLPPLAEQRRIVARLEELLPLIDSLAAYERELDAIEYEFPDAIRKSLLQAAIQGRLTQREPNDGDARDLLKDIQAEKARLISEGKIRRANPLPPINDDEIPFDIPDNWCWVRLGEIASLDMGKTPSRSDLSYWEGNIPWVAISDMRQGETIIKTKERITSLALSNVFTNKLVKAGTLLMSFKLTIGRCCILGFDAVHNEAIVSIYPFVSPQITKSYLMQSLPLLTILGDVKGAMKGSTLNSTSLNNLLIPLPPLAEQRRIVARLEELLKLVDELG